MALKRLCCFFLICTGLLGNYSILAQAPVLPVVSGEFKNITAEKFLLQLENQTGFHFYFDTSQLSSIQIDLSVTRQPLLNVLSLAFVNTGIGFAYDAPDKIFISKGQVVQTALPRGFFRYDKNNKNDTLEESNIAGFSDNDNKAQNATQQNKLYAIGQQNSSNGQPAKTITGFILNNKTGEPVIGASINVEGTTIDVITDQFGYYTLSVPKGRHTLSIQSIGMKDTKREIMVYGDGKFNIEMQAQIISLKRVIVSAEKASNIRSLQMGVQKIDIKTIKQVPVVFGEADVLRVVLTLPGVKSVGEASTGLNVRGGSTDQNLILFNDATIYNPSHFFGLFSAFNPEAIKDVELYKSSIPA